MEIEMNRHLLTVIVSLGILFVLMFIGIWALRGYGLSEFRPKGRREAPASDGETTRGEPIEPDGP